MLDKDWLPDGALDHLLGKGESLQASSGAGASSRKKEPLGQLQRAMRHSFAFFSRWDVLVSENWQEDPGTIVVEENLGKTLDS